MHRIPKLLQWMWMEETCVLGIIDTCLASMMEAGLRMKGTMQKAERKDGRSQVLAHIIATTR